MDKNEEDSRWVREIVPVLNEGYQVKIPFQGTSMYPFIVGNRDQAVLASVARRKLRRGDICLYVRSDGTHVLHRIHHIKNKDYFMLGDAQTSLEGPIEEARLVAYATSFIRKGRELSCHAIGYRLLTQLWLALRIFRPVIFKITYKIRDIFKI
jgi:hypothetical protein